MSRDGSSGEEPRVGQSFVCSNRLHSRPAAALAASSEAAAKRRGPRQPGTGSSNPFPSSGEAGANLIAIGGGVDADGFHRPKRPTR
jgi:hypothetical protein